MEREGSVGFVPSAKSAGDRLVPRFGRVLQCILIVLISLGLFRQNCPGQETVRERVKVDIIRLPFWLTGSTASDLSVNDLSLVVDGKPVPIDTLNVENSVSGTALTGAIESGRPSEIDRPGVLPLETIIFIDESTAAWLERRNVFDDLVRYLGPGKESRRVLVYSFRKGFLHLECPWTSDSATSRSVLAKLRNHPTLEFSSSGVVTNRSSLFEFEFFRHKLLGALLEALAAFPNHPARRQLILITGGRTLATPKTVPNQADGRRNAEDGANQADGRQNPLTGPREIVEQDQTNFHLWSRAVGVTAGALNNSDIVEKAIERDIALITIDTSTEGGMAGAENKRLVDTPARPVLSTELEIAQALTVIGKDTGGEFIPSRMTADGLSAIDQRRRFAITFRDPFEGDHRFHQVVLRCRLPKVTLGYRHGFRVADADDQILDAVLANLVMPLEPGRVLALDVSATLSRRDDGRPLTLLQFRYSPPRSSSDTADRPVDVIAVGRTPNGGWTAPIRWRGTAKSGASTGIYEATHNLGIAPGGYTWSVAFRDKATSLVEYATLTPPISR